MKYRLLGKSGLRVSEAALGTMTSETSADGDHRRLKRRKSIRPTARQVETSLTLRTSTPTVRAKDALESSSRAIARALS
jgi:hypothetical protein